MRARLSGYVALLGLVVVTFFVGSASGASITLNYSYEPGSGVTGQPAASGTTQLGTTGGPFIATVGSGPIGIYKTGDAFATFCVEAHEDFYPSTSYQYSVVVSDHSVQATDSVLPGHNTSTGIMLSSEVAYLYANYMANTMTSVIGSAWKGNSDPNSVQSLQNAIWYFMGYQTAATSSGGFEPTTGLGSAGAWVTGITSSNSTYVNGDHSLTYALEQAAISNVNGSKSLYNVRVMQMTYYPGGVGLSQDQLVMVVPTPTASMAGLSLLGGLGLVGWIKRRRNVVD